MIPVFKPQHVRWLPKPITLWAVWEGTDGNHHEKAYEYRNSRFYDENIIYIGEGAHPLLTYDYRENRKQVLPGTLRFIRVEDVTKLHRIIYHRHIIDLDIVIVYDHLPDLKKEANHG